ncbi:MAG TPA: rhodanese-like domain-containing protein [Candidatus Saccharimonadales bacterium]|nr:rhodanese-like domain-containing protein [Candidatus Saccharimonadales bacterium]
MNAQPGVPTIDVRTAAARLEAIDAPPMLVDVREVNEFLDVRAPGAVLMPLSSFPMRFRELPTDRLLLVICHVGGRSLAAAAHLMASGYPDVANVAGGMAAWEQAGLPTRHGPVAPGEGDLPTT